MKQTILSEADISRFFQKEIPRLVKEVMGGGASRMVLLAGPNKSGLACFVMHERVANRVRDMLKENKFPIAYSTQADPLEPGQ